MKSALKISMFFILIILLTSPNLFAQKEVFGSAEQRVLLTDSEKAWLKAHPDIVLGYTDSLEPDVIVNSDGTYSGMVVDILNELNEELGTNIRLGIYPIPKLLKNAQERKVDGILNIHPEYSEELGLLTTQAYWPAYMTVFARKGVLFDGPEDFSGKRVAVIDGVYFTKKYMEAYGKQATIVKVKDALTGLQSVDKGEVDYFLGASYNAYYIPKYQLFDVFTAYVFWDVPEMFGIAVRSDWPQLVSILNKWISNFSKEEIHAIVTKWSNLPTKQVTIELTPEEKAWLKAHPDIVLGYNNSFEPTAIVDPNGSYRGIVVDFLDALNKRLGIHIALRIDSVAIAHAKAKAKETDGIALIHPNYADKLGFLKTKTYFRSYPIVFGLNDISFEQPDDFVGKRVAIIDEVYFSETIIHPYKDRATILKVKDAREGLDMVYKKKADLFFGISANNYLITKHRLFGIAPKYVFLDSLNKFGMAIRPDWPILVSILNKGISSFSEEEIDTIVAKWINPPQQEKQIELTPEEQAWIAENHTVRVRVTDSAPYLYSEKGKPVGIAVDLLKMISESTGIKFHFVIPSPPFAQDLKGLIQHTGPDLIATIMPTPEREKNILFTDIYISSPWFIFTRDDAPFVASMNDLNGRTVAVVKDYLVHEDIIKNYPDIELLICKNNKEALSAVSLGKAFAFIGDLMSTPAMINKFGLNNLKAVSPGSLQEHKTAMGIRSDWPELRDIISKVLDSMPASEKTAIINKWASVKFDYGISSADVKKWVLISGSIAALILFLIVFWNRSLTRKVEERTTTLAESEERFRSTFEQAAVGIAHVSPEGRFLRINQKFCDIVGYSLEEMLALTFQDITHPDDLDPDLAEVQRLLRREAETYSIEKRYIYKNGETVWVNLTVSLIRKKNGEPSWFVAVVEDITPRKLAEEALRESEEKFRNLMEQSSLSIQILGVDGRIIQVNEAWKKLWGFSDELLQEVLEKYNILEDEEAIELGVMPLIEKAFAGESVILPVIEYDAAVTVERIGVSGSEGNKRWIEVRLYPIKNSFGEVVNIVDIEEDITERKQAEKEILRYHERLKALAFQLTVTEEKERRRIADDLHDQIGQSLALARMQIASAKKSATDAGQAAKLDDISEILREAVHDTRHLMFDLSPPAMHQIGMGAAISEWLEDQIEKRYGIKTEFFDNLDKRHRKVLDENVRAILFRNVRELLINVVKHAQANQVTVLMEVTDGVLKIVVQDDGVGFDSREVSQPEGIKRGFGLFSIEERMTDLGGALEIESQPGKGGRAILTVPLVPKSASGSASSP